MAAVVVEELGTQLVEAVAPVTDVDDVDNPEQLKQATID